MRIFAISAAAAALSLGALSVGATAAASPFTLSATNSADSNQEKADSRGFIKTMVDSTVNAFGIVFSAGDPHEEGILLRYYKDEEACPAEETAEAEAEPEAAEEEQKLVGPEPIYFGF